VRIDSSAPTRIDLAGGTYDIWPLYLLHERAQTINAALSLRAHTTLCSRRDYRILIVSEDTGEHVEAAEPAALGVDRLPLVARLVRHFGARGLEVHTRSDSPVGAGIAGSSAMAVSVAAALAAWTGRTLTDEELLTVAMNVEAQVIQVPTGVQDYRPAYYGGVSAVEMDVRGVRRTPLAVDRGELERRLVLAYTGASRNSGINNWNVMMQRINGDPAAIAAFDGIRDAALGVREGLERHDWAAVAQHLANEWTHRKRLAPGVTTPEIDRLFARAEAAGARAGKVCGAGGGGCLFCLVDPDHRAAVAEALSVGGATVLPFALDGQGLELSRS
jgi:D-glycero-alpha-D-manno-heptose-7-phosphate kinase